MSALASGRSYLFVNINVQLFHQLLYSRFDLSSSSYQFLVLKNKPSLKCIVDRFGFTDENVEMANPWLEVSLGRMDDAS